MTARKTAILIMILSALFVIYPLRSVLFEASIFAHMDRYFLEMPIKSYFFDGLAQGELRSLYPGNMMGTSLLANPHYGVFNPLNLLYLFWSPLSAFGVMSFLEIMLFLAAAYLLVADRIPTRLAVFNAIAALVTSPFLYALMFRIGDLASFAWAMFTIAACERGMRQGSQAWLGLAAAGSFFTLWSGDPLLAGLATLLAGLRFATFRDDQRENAKLSHWPLFVLWLALLLLFHTVPLLYVVDSLPLTIKSIPYPPALAKTYSLDSSGLLAMISPLWEQPHTTKPEAWYPFLGINLTIFAVVLGAMVMAKGKRSLFTYAGMLIAAFCLLLSLGNTNPLADRLWDVLGLPSVLRFPEKLVKYAMFCTMAVYLTAFADAAKEWRFLQRSRWQLAWLLFNLLSLLTLPRLAGVAKDEFDRQAIPLIIRQSMASSPNPRLHSCVDLPHGSALKSAFMGDVKFWGIPILVSAEASYPPFLKFASCRLMAKYDLFNSFGVSHLLLAQADVADIPSRYIEKANVISPDLILLTLKGGPYPDHLGVYFQFKPVGADFESSLRTEAARLSERDETALGERMQGLAPIDARFSLRTNGFKHTPASLPAALPGGERCQAQVSRQQIEASSQGLLSYRIDSSCALMLSLPWNFTVAWTASLDGAPVTMQRFLWSSLAVALPQGQHRLVLDHRAEPFFGWLLLVYGLSLVSLLWLWMPSRMGRHVIK